MTRPVPFRYLAITSRSVCPESIPNRIRRLLKLGVPAVQVRDKEVPDRQRWDWIQSLRGCSGRLLINGRADVAYLADLEGVHRPQDSLPVDFMRQLLDESCWIGESTHTLEEALRAQERDVDYITFGPVFPTPSKPNRTEDQIPGLKGLREVCQKVEVPVLALGGVGAENLESCLGAGCQGAAGIRALFAPRNPRPTWERLKTTLDRWFQ